MAFFCAKSSLHLFEMTVLGGVEQCDPEVEQDLGKLNELRQKLNEIRGS